MYFNLNSKIFLLIPLFLGTMICISSNSWIAMWLGLELNLLSFIPIMIKNKNILTSEASLKYFLVQAMASSLFLMSILMLMILHEIINIKIFMISNITFIVMIMKLGSAPLHFWMPSVMEGLSWMNCLILLTWQKIAPFIIISYLSISFSFLSFFIISSIIFGSLGGLNQTSLHKLMAYSSISHLGWMLLALTLNQSSWTIYFLIYSFLLMNLIYLFSSFSSHHISHFITKMKPNKKLKLILMSNLFSLGGLPPFLGFLPKWMIIQQASTQNLNFIILILVLFTLVTLFYYMRMLSSTILFNSIQLMYNFSNYRFMFFFLFSSSVSFLGLFVYPLLTFF